MKLSSLGQLFLKGAVVLLPIVMTLSVIWWLLVSLEGVLAGVLFWLFPGLPAVPGLGLVLAIVLIFVTGILVQIYVTRWLLEWVERLLKRIPLVGTVYESIRDVLTFVSGTKKREGLKQVVLVSVMENRKVLGFVTNRSVELNEQELVAVYLPMSYQVGGYTIYVAASELEYLDISVEAAMRATLTAHMTGSG